MNTNTHLWPYLAHLFVQWEIFQTNVAKMVKSHILCSATFFEHHAVHEILWKTMVQPDRSQMTIWPMRMACCVDYIILFAFPQQQCFHEPASLLHCTTLPVLFSLNLYGTLELIIMQEHWLYLLTCIFNLWECVLNSGDENDNSVYSRNLLRR